MIIRINIKNAQNYGSVKEFTDISSLDGGIINPSDKVTQVTLIDLPLKEVDSVVKLLKTGAYKEKFEKAQFEYWGKYSAQDSVTFVECVASHKPSKIDLTVLDINDEIAENLYQKLTDSKCANIILKFVFSPGKGQHTLSQETLSQLETLTDESIEFQELESPDQEKPKSLEADQEKPKLLEVYKDLGDKYFRSGEYKNAIEAFQEAIKLSSTNEEKALFHKCLGEAFYKSGNYKDSIESYQEGIKLDISTQMKIKLYVILGNTHLNSRNYKDALESYEEVIRLSPSAGNEEKDNEEEMAFSASNQENIRLFMNSGSNFYNSGNYKDAIESYQKAISVNIKGYESYLRSGNDFYRSSKHKEAAKSYKKVIELIRDIFELHSALGNAFCRSGKYKDAVESYKKAIKPGITKDPQLHKNLGDAFLGLEQYKDAVESYQKAIDLSIKDDPQLHSALGNAFCRSGKYKDATKSYQKAIELSIKDDPQLHKDLGDAFLGLEQYQNAVESYKKAIRFSSANDPQLYKDLGDAFLKSGKSKEALETYEQAFCYGCEDKDLIEIYKSALSKCGLDNKLENVNPKDYRAERLWLEGKVLLEKDSAKAIKSFNKAREEASQESKNIYAHKLAQIHSERREYDKAIELYKKLVKSKNALYCYELGEIYKKTKELTKAQASFKQASELNPEDERYKKSLEEVSAQIKSQAKKGSQIDTLPQVKIEPKKEDEAGASKAIAPSAVVNEVQKPKATEKQDEAGPSEVQNPGKSDYESGIELIKQKKFAEAIVEINKAIEKEQDNHVYLHDLGKAYYELDNFEEAITAYQKAIASNPSNSHYHNNLGVALEASELYEEAAESYLNAIDREKNVVFFTNYGDALSASGTIEKQIIALIAYSNALHVGVVESEYVQQKLLNLQESIRGSHERKCTINTTLPINAKVLGNLEVALQGNTKLLRIDFNCDVSEESKTVLERIMEQTSIINMHAGKYFLFSDKNQGIREEKYKAIFQEVSDKSFKQYTVKLWEKISEIPFFEDLFSDSRLEIMLPLIQIASRSEESLNDLVKTKDQLILGMLFSEIKELKNEEDTEKKQQKEAALKEIISNKKYGFDVLKHLNDICNAKFEERVKFILEYCSPTKEDLDSIKITKNTQLSLVNDFIALEYANCLNPHQNPTEDLEVFRHFFKVIARQTSDVDLASVLDKLGIESNLLDVVLKAILVHRPNDIDMNIKLADYYMHKGLFDKSFDLYARAIELSKDNTDGQLVNLVSKFESVASKCFGRHQDMIKILAEVKGKGVESDTYNEAVDAYIKAKPQPSSPEAAKSDLVAKKVTKSVKFADDVKFATEWKINKKVISLDKKYVVAVEGLGHDNCYAAITKGVFELYQDPAVRSKFKTAIGKSAGAQNETGIKKLHSDSYELKIKGSNGTGDIRLTATYAFKGINKELLILFDKDGDHGTASKAPATKTLDYDSDDQTTYSYDLAALGDISGAEE